MQAPQHSITWVSHKWFRFHPHDTKYLPEYPGVYVFYREGVVAYVGRTTDLKHRLMKHRNSGFEYGKAQMMKSYASRRRLEHRLMRRLKPTDNVQVARWGGLF